MFSWFIGKIDCYMGVHDWSPEDLNELTPQMETGDEATIRCHRCNKQVVTVRKKANGDMKWIAHVKEAVLYEVNPEFTRTQGQKYNLGEFREDNK